MSGWNLAQPGTILGGSIPGPQCKPLVYRNCPHTHAPADRQNGRSRNVLRRAGQKDNDEDLWRIHQELIDQLEERKRAKNQMLAKLGRAPAEPQESSPTPSRPPVQPQKSSPAASKPPSSAPPRPSYSPRSSNGPPQQSQPATPPKQSQPAASSWSRATTGSSSGGSAGSDEVSRSDASSRSEAQSRLEGIPRSAERFVSPRSSRSETFGEQETSRRSSPTAPRQPEEKAAPRQPSPRLTPGAGTYDRVTTPIPTTSSQEQSAPSNNGSTQQAEHADLSQEAKQEPQKMHNENAMNVVLVGAECAPWSKTGGLGDVMSALPKALSRRGHRVMAIAPRYENYAEGWETGVRIRVKVFDQEQEVGFFHGYIDGVDWVFIDHPSFHGFANNIYGGNRQDITFRCALLCKAAIEAVKCVPCGGATYGDNNLVFIANDWHTALLPVYLQAHYRDYEQMTYARSVFIIHNIAHQGRGPMDELAPLEIPDHHRELFRLYDPIGGEHMNIMKAAFITAHRIVAVSHGYAWECQTQEGGWGLDNVLRENNWKLRGIVNGMDYHEWNPMTDKFLNSDGYRHYSQESFAEGKAACKAALQRELGLPEDPSIPLLGFIGRLDYQKGVDLITESFDWLMDQGCQLVMLGSGREDLENSLRSMESSRHNQCRGWVGFSVPMAHRITAGCDILLMPSRFEPCGLNQLYAMAYGTVPVVHAVGGLRDTVKPYNPYDNTGTGWTYEWSSGEAFRDAIWNAIYTFRDHKKSFIDVAKRGMHQDLSWDNAAQQYEEVLLAAKYQW